MKKILLALLFVCSGAFGATPFSVYSLNFPAPAASAPTNGVYSPNTNQVGISTGGSNRLIVDALGNAGLGVTPDVWTSAVTALQVKGAASGFPAHYMKGGYRVKMSAVFHTTHITMT